MMIQQCAVSVSVSGGVLHRPTASLLALCRHKGGSKSVVGIFPQCSERYADATEELFRYASFVGAHLTVLYSSQPAAALLEFVRSSDVTNLIIGKGIACGADRLISHMLPDVAISSEFGEVM